MLNEDSLVKLLLLTRLGVVGTGKRESPEADEVLKEVCALWL